MTHAQLAELFTASMNELRTHVDQALTAMNEHVDRHGTAINGLRIRTTDSEANVRKLNGELAAVRDRVAVHESRLEARSDEQEKFDLLFDAMQTNFHTLSQQIKAITR